MRLTSTASSRRAVPFDRPLLLCGLLSSVVVIEPAPVDLLLVGLSTIWLVGQRLRIPALGAGLGLAYVAMSVISQLIGQANGYGLDARIVRDILIEGYLVLACVALFAKFSTDRNAIRSFFTGVVLGAVIVSSTFLVLRVVGRVPDIFFRDEFRSRVRGLFKDPNVLGPFLVMPILLLLVRNEIVKIPFAKVAAIPCTVLLMLTFSRGAYVAFAVALFVLGAAMFVRERITYSQAAIAVVGMTGVLGVAALLWGSASGPVTSDLIEASGLVNTDRLGLQAYDTERFATNFNAWAYVVDNPFGNGIQAFARQAGLNPHNLFLGKAVDAGLAAAILVVAVPTVAMGRALFARTDMPRFAAITSAALAGTMAVSTVIHSHHWRHLFFITAVAFAISARARMKGSDLDLRDPTEFTGDATNTSVGASLTHQQPLLTYRPNTNTSRGG